MYSLLSFILYLMHCKMYIEVSFVPIVDTIEIQDEDVLDLAQRKCYRAIITASEIKNSQLYNKVYKAAY